MDNVQEAELWDHSRTPRARSRSAAKTEQRRAGEGGKERKEGGRSLSAQGGKMTPQPGLSGTHSKPVTADTVGYYISITKAFPPSVTCRGLDGMEKKI